MKRFEPPIGIILTMPRAFFEDRKMTEEAFCKSFERYMQRDDALWNYKKKLLPTEDVAFVYLVWGGKVQFRCNFVCYERNVSKAFDDSWDGKTRSFPGANWIILTGPAVRPPREIPMKGFQGHRYVTKELW
jgi:hypothetical protein